MKVWKRILAAFLCLLMVTSVLPAMNLISSPIKTASAAAPAAYFSEVEF